MTIRFAPKFLTAAAALGAVLAFSAPALAWGNGPHGPGPYGYHRPAPPPVYHAPPRANPYHYGPPRHWGWRHHRRPPPWAYGYRW